MELTHDYKQFEKELIDLYVKADFEINQNHLSLPDNFRVFTDFIKLKDYTSAYKLFDRTILSHKILKEIDDAFNPYIKGIEFKVEASGVKRNKALSSDKILSIADKLATDIPDEKPVIISVNKPYNYQTLRYVMLSSYEQYARRMFIISNEISVKGQIIASLNKAEELILSEVYKVKAPKGEEEGFRYNLYTFAGTLPRGQIKVPDSAHTEIFYQYQFQDNRGQDYIVYSREKIDKLGRCTIQGMRVELDDTRRLGEESKIKIKQPILFVYNLEYEVKKFTDEEMEVTKLEYNWEELAQAYFGKYNHPDWFKRLMIAQSLVLREFNHPLHIFVMAQQGTYKTHGILKCLKQAYGETTPLISGTSSTIKGITVSHRENPPTVGALFRSERMSCIDEFMQMLKKSVSKGERSEEIFAAMTTILDHERFTSPSGNGSADIQLHTRCVFTTNPPVTTRTYDFIELVRDTSNPFISRLLMYKMNKIHIAMLRKGKMDILRYGKDMYPAKDDNIASFIDTLSDMKAEIDFERIENIYEEYKQYVPDELMEVYNSRYYYHLANLLAGITKMNFILDNTKNDLIATDLDYTQTEEIFANCIFSWTEDIDLSKIKPSIRIHYMSPEHNEMYNYIDQKRSITRKDIMTTFEKMNKKEMILTSLWNADIIKKEGDIYHPHWYSGVPSVQTRLEQISAGKTIDVDNFTDDELEGLSKEGLIHEFTPGNYKKI